MPWGGFWKPRTVVFLERDRAGPSLHMSTQQACNPLCVDLVPVSSTETVDTWQVTAPGMSFLDVSPTRLSVIYPVPPCMPSAKEQRCSLWILQKLAWFLFPCSLLEAKEDCQFEQPWSVEINYETSPTPPTPLPPNCWNKSKVTWNFPQLL